MQRRMRERIFLIAILALFMLCCCLSFWVGMVNYTLRDVLGILPTFTPSPVPSTTPQPTELPLTFIGLLEVYFY